MGTALFHCVAGGGWTLVVTIDKDSRDHLKREENCLSPTFCVPFKDLSDDQVLRKFRDEDIQLLANKEGQLDQHISVLLLD